MGPSPSGVALFSALALVVFMLSQDRRRSVWLWEVFDGFSDLWWRLRWKVSWPLRRYGAYNLALFFAGLVVVGVFVWTMLWLLA